MDAMGRAHHGGNRKGLADHLYINRSISNQNRQKRAHLLTWVEVVLLT
jgi:hypothetical protein